MIADATRDLVSRLADLLHREHGALADFLVALAELDRVRGWRELGYASLFDFLHRELGLSKGTAFYRKTAAELVQRYPEVVEPIRDGRLCITAVVELARVITPENRREVLPRFFHCSKQEAKAVAVEIAPRAAVPQRDVVTALPVRDAPAPVPVETSSLRVQLVELACPEGTISAPALGTDIRLPPAPPTRDIAEPVTADLRRLHVTVSKRFLDKLEAARCALSRSIPGATTEAILEAALDLVLARDAKRKGLVARPRPAGPTPPPGSHDVPAAVSRAIWTRDQGRCQFPLESGGVCGSTYRVQLDHIRPVALGGLSTEANLRLACERHNDLAARRVLGDACMDRHRTARRSPRAGGARVGAAGGAVDLQVPPAEVGAEATAPRVRL